MIITDADVGTEIATNGTLTGLAMVTPPAQYSPDYFCLVADGIVIVNQHMPTSAVSADSSILHDVEIPFKSLVLQSIAPGSSYDLTIAGPAEIGTTFNYDYESQGGQPASGQIYQNKSNLDQLTVNYSDYEGNDNTTILQGFTVGDTITCNGITWNITGVTPKGNNIIFLIDPAMSAPPFGVTAFQFTKGS